MNWFKKATAIMKLDWKTAYQELLAELKRVPTSEEVRKKMYDDSELSRSTEFDSIDFDRKTKYDDLPFNKR